jgi:hypothetical protein
MFYVPSKGLQGERLVIRDFTPQRSNSEAERCAIPMCNQACVGESVSCVQYTVSTILRCTTTCILHGITLATVPETALTLSPIQTISERVRSLCLCQELMLQLYAQMIPWLIPPRTLVGWLVGFDRYTTAWRMESRCWHFRPTFGTFASYSPHWRTVPLAALHRARDGSKNKKGTCTNIGTKYIQYTFD